MASVGRSGSRRTTKRQAIFDATERLMLTEGYGTVTYRSVATAAGVAPGLVQYYFPSLDVLFIAVLREATDRLVDQLTDAARSQRPLRAIWAYASDPSGSALLLQFMALANGIPEVGSVIGEGGERVRQALVHELSARWPAYGLDHSELTPAAAVFLLSAVPRMMHLEQSLGTTTGHTDARAMIEAFLDRVEPKAASRRANRIAEQGAGGLETS
jgi:AcrR family transcriptional regulator